jgi:enamine deaminase RidA (YjgF/YER057c/UK114 family)
VDDFAGQAAKCIENLNVALHAMGGTLSHIAYTRVLVASSRREDLGTVWAVVRDAFGAHEHLARSLV